jgi:hypothetical protein
MELLQNGFQIRSVCNAIDENSTRKLSIESKRKSQTTAVAEPEKHWARIRFEVTCVRCYGSSRKGIRVRRSRNIHARPNSLLALPRHT